MASGAVVYERRMIYRCRNPRADLMTNITLIRRLYVRRTFSSCQHVIMTTAAHSDNFIVIHGTRRDRKPGGEYMAGFAKVGGVNMRRVLPGGLHTIVTGNTGLTNYSIVVEADQPTGGDMTHVAGFGRCNMGGTFTPGNHPVMTAFAGANDLRVIRGAGC